MAQTTTAAKPATPQAQPIDMDGVKAWFAEQAGKEGTAMTPKEMAAWDEKTRAAWSPR